MLTLRYYKKLVTVTIGNHTIKAEAKKISQEHLLLETETRIFFLQRPIFFSKIADLEALNFI